MSNLKNLDIKPFYVILEMEGRERFFHACEFAHSKKDAFSLAESDRYWAKEILIYDVVHDEIIWHWDRKLGVLRKFKT